MPKGTKNANAIRALTMDAVQRAGCGHPGAPMGMAEIAEVLWTNHLKHNPNNPKWPDRDRFVLSNGHGSMLLYSMLHLSGYDLSIEQLKNFRQLDSKTAGHPEYGEAPGIETTTGPLGQGFANAVGMALAEKVLSSRFNRDRFKVVDHKTYVFVGDGCLMEGISHEAASLAGTLNLSNLICIYDANQISIDGNIDGWFTDDTPSRFRAYGWEVLEDIDGHSLDDLDRAISESRRANAPCLIICKTTIGFGSPNKEGTASSHGSPLGEEEVTLTREKLNWTWEPFEIPQDVYDAWNCKDKGEAAEQTWRALFSQYKEAFPDLAREFEENLSGKLPSTWTSSLLSFARDLQKEAKPTASRNASRLVIEKLDTMLPNLMGGSADLSGSNCTDWSKANPLTRDDASGNYISYGVREFGMTAISNGIALHGGLRPFSGTFLVFLDYAKNAVRMASLMKIPNIFVYTHDSIGQGEDGPTHQPVEQLSSLRTTPNMNVWRPCDAVETVFAWKAAIERIDGPTSLVFSRQSLPSLKRTESTINEISKGAYIIFESGSQPDILIIATGSEVSLGVAVAEIFSKRGISIQVVSMPCVEIFDSQPKAYRDRVLPPNVTKRVAIEAAHTNFWHRYIGPEGVIVGIDSFGASAPGEQLFARYGFTSANIEEAVEGIL